jgi:hypothetical protein
MTRLLPVIAFVAMVDVGNAEMPHNRRCDVAQDNPGNLVGPKNHPTVWWARNTATIISQTFECCKVRSRRELRLIPGATLVPSRSASNR